MSEITEAEKLRRRKSNKSILGTPAMEGLFSDEATTCPRNRFDYQQLQAIDHLHP